MALVGVFGRTFGVEFELPTELSKEEMVGGLRRAGIDVTDTENYTHDVTDGWKIVSDSSIEPAGWECVSPILKGPGGINEVLRFCEAIQGMGIDMPKGNTSCGFHVHVGADDLDGNAVARLIRFHHHIERHGLLECVPKSRRDNEYCQPTHEGVLRAAKEGPITFDQVRQITDSRYVALNMFGRCAKYGTVEFRRHSGTVEGPKASAWILLNLHMVTAAAHLGRSGYGRKLEECFRAIYMYDTGDWSAWAAHYLTARRQNLAGDRCRYPDMPALPSYEGEVGLGSFSVLRHGGLSFGAEASLESLALSAHMGELSAGPFAVRAGGKFGGGIEGGVPVVHAGLVSTPCSIQ